MIDHGASSLTAGSVSQFQNWHYRVKRVSKCCGILTEDQWNLCNDTFAHPLIQNNYHTILCQSATGCSWAKVASIAGTVLAWPVLHKLRWKLSGRLMLEVLQITPIMPVNSWIWPIPVCDVLKRLQPKTNRYQVLQQKTKQQSRLICFLLWISENPWIR